MNKQIQNNKQVRSIEEAKRPATTNVATYRWFLVNGDILVHGEEVWFYKLESAPIADLPPGEAGKQAMAERVRQHFVQDHHDPQARWKRLNIREVPAGEIVRIEDDPFP